MSLEAKANITNRLLLVYWLLVLGGCAHYDQHHVVPHAGSYEFVDLGFDKSVKPYRRIARAHNKIIYAYPDATGPSFFSLYLTEHAEIKQGETVLDMGTGSGVQTIHAAGKASRVLATDISEDALKSVAFNAQRHAVTHKVEARNSDIFDNIRDDEVFDVVLVSLPYPYDEKTQVFWRLYDRFFTGVGRHLKPEGRIYFLSGELKNLSGIRHMVQKNDLKIMRIDMVTDVVNRREMIVYMIQHFPEGLRPRPNEVQAAER
jgi:release factor glutamine methyltransferase